MRVSVIRSLDDLATAVPKSALVLVGIITLFGLLALLLILLKCRGGDYVKIEVMRGAFTLQYGKPAEVEPPPEVEASPALDQAGPSGSEALEIRPSAPDLGERSSG